MSRSKRLTENRSPFTVHRSPFTPHRADEPDKRTLDPVARIQSVCQVAGESKPPTQFELRLQLTGRTECDLEKARLFFPPGPAAPLCDVRRHRDGSPPYLRNEVEPLIRRERSSQPIHRHREGRRFLPDSEIPIFLHSLSLHRYLIRCKGHKTIDSVRERHRRMAMSSQWPTVNGSQ